MPEDTEGRSSSEDRKATENVLTQKFGPLPLFVWVALGAGVLGAFILLKKKGAAPASAQPVGVPGTQGGGGSSSGGADTSGFVSSSQEATDISTVGQQISDLSKSVTDQLAGVQANETALGTGITNTNAGVAQVQSNINSLGNTVAGLNHGVASATGPSSADIAALASEIQALAGSGSFAGQSSVAAIGQQAGQIAARNSGGAVSASPGGGNAPAPIAVSEPSALPVGADAATIAANPGRRAS